MSTEKNLQTLYENSVKILTDLIAFKTVSGEDNNSLINYCDEILKKLGATSFKTFDEDKKRVNLFATLKAKKPNGKAPIILSGHTDVVPVSKGWSTNPFEAVIKEDKLYGRGSCDMKGFIACTLAYAPIFSKSDLNRDIHFSFTFDEETACKGAPILIQELKKRGLKNGICIVGEPTNMKIIDAHKGCYEYTTYFEGLAGHSSQPHKGVSAVEYAARYVNKLIELRQKLKDRAPKNSIFDPPHSTLSIGGIFGGFCQPFIGALSDNFNKRIIIFLLLFSHICWLMLLNFSNSNPYLIIFALMISGFASTSLYTVTLAYLGERINVTDIAFATSLFIIIYELGEYLGPIIVGFNMSIYGNSGFIYTLSSFVIVCIIFGIIRSLFKKNEN